MVTPGSGLLAVAVMVDGLPACTVAGFTEQLTCGGFIGFALTVKVAVQVALLFFLYFGSVMVAVAVTLVVVQDGPTQIPVVSI